MRRRYRQAWRRGGTNNRNYDADVELPVVLLMAPDTPIANKSSPGKSDLVA